MVNGCTPLGRDGQPFELHHWHREEKASFLEISHTLHRGEGFSKLWHKGFTPSEPVDRDKFNPIRENYWKWWAREYLDPWEELFKGE
jgi:hypothetical protein